MSLSVCSVCHRVPSKLCATFYWAWTFPSGLRVCHRQRRCKGDTIEVGQRIDWATENLGSCVVCKEPIELGDDITVFCSLFIPKHDPESFAWGLHMDCHPLDLGFYTQGSVRMPDRPRDEKTPPPQDDWAGGLEGLKIAP